MSDKDEALKKRLDAYVDTVWEDVVSDIDALVKIRSVEDLGQAKPGMPWGPASHEALVKALDIAARLGLDAHECEGYLGFADLAGSSKKQIATIAHSDVVPEGLGWSHHPFEVTRKEGYLIGRGVLDDKGPLVLSLYAAKFFADQVQRSGKRLPYTLRCIIGNDEETTMGDVAWYLEHFEEPAFLFTPDADFPLICGEKGVFHGVFKTKQPLVGDTGLGSLLALDGGTVANAIPGQAEALIHADAAALPPAEDIELIEQKEGLLRLVAHGKGGHASMPDGTRNAIGILADYLAQSGIGGSTLAPFFELEHLLCSQPSDGSLLGIATQNDRFGPLTCIGGTVRTEDGYLVQTVDIRYPDSTTDTELASALDALAATHGCSFAISNVQMPFYIDPDSSEIQTLLATYREFTGDTTEPLVIGGGTYARHFTRACAFGPHDPKAAVPAWIGPEHGPDEGISEAALQQALKIYIVSIARLMELDL